MPDLDPLVERIIALRAATPAAHSVLVAVSGIDGSGKGYVSARLAELLARRALHAVVITADGWLNLPERRFDQAHPAERFYQHAIRFEELLAELVLPLRERRTLRVESRYLAETASAFEARTWDFVDVDVILLEGIFLLKRELRAAYDCSVWIDCSFETALRRAVARAQEGLPEEATIRAYQTIYFPAQRIHLERDDPIGAASVVLRNDP